jgi:hypothetical protein
MISGNVAPLERFIIAITSAVLLLPSAFGLLAGFLAGHAFFGWAFLPPFASAFGLRGIGRVLADGLAIDCVFRSLSFSLSGLRSSESSLRLRKTSREICGD